MYEICADKGEGKGEHRGKTFKTQESLLVIFY